MPSKSPKNGHFQPIRACFMLRKLIRRLFPDKSFTKPLHERACRKSPTNEIPLEAGTFL